MGAGKITKVYRILPYILYNFRAIMIVLNKCNRVKITTIFYYLFDTIMNKTFILGAGASAPYGFPLGSKLKIEVSKMLSSIEHPVTKYLYCKFNKDNNFPTLVLKLRDSPLQSIDHFLSNHIDFSDFVYAGKYIIAYLINNCEDKSKMFTGIDNDWYGYLFNKMIPLINNDLNKLNKLNIKFITFNYDRSLECFLINAARYSFNISEDHLLPLMNDFIQKNIVHIHGHLGDINKIDYKFYGNDNLEIYEKMANNIKIYQEKDDGNIISKIDDILDNSTNIYFLGFGYLIENLNKLHFPKKSHSLYKVYGSRFGIKWAELVDIKQYFQKNKNRSINFMENLTDLPWDLNCYHFMRNCIQFSN